MRLALITLGAAAILAYSVLGALLIANWEVTAASGLPLDETITAMRAADQPYSVVPGIVFAVVGALLAVAWCATSLVPAASLSHWFVLALWAAIIAFGAPAYFFASFGNMNSVGDTFFDWNSEAAFALVVPLYLASGIAALVAVAAAVTGAVRAGVRKAAAATP